MSTTTDDLKALKPDALTPVETAAKLRGIARAKTALPPAKCFVSAIMAGLFVSFGAMFFGLFLSDTTLPFAASRLVGGICFCMGLVLILCCGAELFTGNMLMISSKVSGEIRLRAVLKNWVIVWLGNLVGALLGVLLIYFAQIHTMNGGAVGEGMVNLAADKVSLDAVPLFFKAVLCNIFVCLAVWIGSSARTVTDKVVGVLLPIAAFAACGFEHCVANMFFLPLGLLLNATGVGVPDAVTLGGIFYNIPLATLGNIVGGLMVGITYWYLYHKKEVTE